MPSDEPGSTAVVISTPEAEPLIGELSRAHTPAGRDAMWPHVTLLVPFVPAKLIDEEDGVLYLAPEPAERFVDVIQALIAAFPDYPPYDGAHDTIVPHATAAVSEDMGFLSRIGAALEPQLPVQCRADAATMVERGSDLRWSLRREYPLGAT